MSGVEKIGAYARHPETSICTVIIPSTKQQAIGLAINHGGSAAFVDSSSRNDLVGIGTHWEKMDLSAVTLTISDTSTLSNSLGELASIESATAQIWSEVKYNALSNRQITVFTDSQYALKALQGLGQDSGQFFTESIARMSHEINSSNTNTNIQFQWSPAHSKVPGNEKAHKLAQTATEKGKNIEPSFQRYPIARSVVSKRAWEVKVAENNTSLMQSKTGRFIKSTDKGIPSSHTRVLYNGKSKTHAGLQCQLRTGICRLNSYLCKIQAVESGQCGCNTGVETVHHFLFCCPLWDRFRPQMKHLADSHNRWGDTSFLLGGWSGVVKDGEFGKWKPNLAMVSATIKFAEDTGRLKKRRRSESRREYVGRQRRIRGWRGRIARTYVEGKFGKQDYYTVDIADAETVDNRKHILGDV